MNKRTPFAIGLGVAITLAFVPAVAVTADTNTSPVTAPVIELAATDTCERAEDRELCDYLADVMALPDADPGSVTVTHLSTSPVVTENPLEGEWEPTIPLPTDGEIVSPSADEATDVLVHCTVNIYFIFIGHMFWTGTILHIWDCDNNLSWFAGCSMMYAGTSLPPGGFGTAPAFRDICATSNFPPFLYLRGALTGQTMSAAAFARPDGQYRYAFTSLVSYSA